MIDVIQIVRARVIQINLVDKSIKVEYSGTTKYEWIRLNQIKRVVNPTNSTVNESALNTNNVTLSGDILTPITSVSVTFNK